MMPEYIKREAAKRLFADSHDYGLARKLDAIPAADVVEVKQGKWIDRINCCQMHVYDCSECDKTNITKSNYCPNCGARMDGDTDG